MKIKIVPRYLLGGLLGGTTPITGEAVANWIEKHPLEARAFYELNKNNPEVIRLFGNNPIVKQAAGILYKRHSPIKSSSTLPKPKSKKSGVLLSISRSVNPDNYLTEEQKEYYKRYKELLKLKKAQVGNIGKMVINGIINPQQAMFDTGLYLADVLGLPSNVTNYLRDLNVAVPQRTKALGSSAVKSLVKGTPLPEEYREELANPSIFTRMSTIMPLTNTDINFSDEERQAIRDMAGEKGYITNEDIKRVDGKYGASGKTIDYITNPVKVVETAIGLAGRGYDIFDFNTLGDVAKRDNQMYVDMDKNITDYAGLRASALNTSSLDIMPNEHKIHTIFTTR